MQPLNSDHKTFEKPKTSGRPSDYVMTSQLNLALEYIGQVMNEATSLPDDEFSSVHDQLVASQNIIKYVIEWMEYDGDGDEDGDGDGV